MFAVVCIVATPFVFVGWLINRIFEHRARMQALAVPRPMPALPLPHDVEQRLANLEAIVASVDFDLAERLRDADRTRGHAA
ncbi:MAG TPA: hypothetical protein VFG69_07770 [Nannocystaceae bacterium]|nr:hypothetical protein [Nannocystaceae bacterium]